MILQPKTYLFITTILVFISGCVSVKLSQEQLAKAKHINYTPPSKPFKTFETHSADKAWKNKQTGSSISYLSSCNEPGEPDLNTIKNNTLSGISDLKILNEKHITFNKREALHVQSTGFLDGIKIHLNLIIFKKNRCNYTLTFISLEQFYETDIKYFNAFVENFEAS